MGIEEGVLVVDRQSLAEIAANEAGHHLAERRDVVFGLLHVRAAFDAELGHVLAQDRERFLIEKPGQIEAGVRQKLPATETDEEGVVFAFSRRGRRIAGELPKRGDATAEVGCVAFESCGGVENILTGRARQQPCQLPVNVGPESLLLGQPRLPPVPCHLL